MKKLIPMLFAALAFFTACEKDPDTDKLDNQYLVFTDHDSNISFDTLYTYYVPDSILYINSGEKKEYWRSPIAEEIRQAFIQNMNERFTRVDDPLLADVGLQLSYVASTYTFGGYGNYPWWYDYPYYWSPGYWGGYWGGFYYPYLVTYSYSTGSIIAEMLDLDNTTTKKLPILWNAYISGLLNASGNINVNKAKAGIEQAFQQSPYLNNAGNR